MNTMASEQVEFLSDNYSRFIALRREFHREPELAFQEFKTSRRISSFLKDIGWEVFLGYGGTGLVAALKGGNGPTIGIRSDIDALPVLEETGLPYSSQTKGNMHACGHDGHITILLATAELLAREKNRPGDVNLYFQPAEEIGKGAQSMLADGVLDKFPCDFLIGYHNWPSLPLGTVSVKAGAQMSAFQSLEIDFKCQGGHAAMPENCPDIFGGVSEFLTQAPIVLKETAETALPTSFAFTRISGGTAINLIPTKVSLEASFRYAEVHQFDLACEFIQNLSKQIELSHNIRTEHRWIEHFGPLLNDENLTSRFIKNLDVIPDISFVKSPYPSMVADDFGYFAERVPSCYFWMGSGQKNTALHANNFDFNDEILKVQPAILHAFIMNGANFSEGQKLKQ